MTDRQAGRQAGNCDVELFGLHFVLLFAQNSKLLKIVLKMRNQSGFFNQNTI